MEISATQTPFIAQLLDTSQIREYDHLTYIATCNLNFGNSSVDIICYDHLEDNFSVGNTYKHVFPPVGGIHWMPKYTGQSEDKVIAIAYDDIHLFKENELICKLAIKNTKMRHYNLPGTSKRTDNPNIIGVPAMNITGFRFNEYNPYEIVSSLYDGCCLLWDIEYNGSTVDHKTKPLEYKFNTNSNIIFDVCHLKQYKLMDVCYGHTKNTIYVAFDNGAALSLDLRTPTKYSTSIVSDCIQGWQGGIISSEFTACKLTYIEDTCLFARALLNKGIVDIFDNRKSCGPLFSIQSNVFNHSNLKISSMDCLKVSTKTLLTVAREDGIVELFDINENTSKLENYYKSSMTIYGFTSINHPLYKNLLGIVSVYDSINNAAYLKMISV
ncbi:hypothetical protein cand_009240 [Cryptosporidium andersoni]|uniref:Uncharacterized protein n=1 Tax=Cryptosporidium andersoni TaxID=117008 RepID=A0A1J4MT54_9CRYT|nr:hypothetical protein cand_009240 [Cryptosporidium andersoni]